jgi:hypothetical protein
MIKGKLQNIIALLAALTLAACSSAGTDGSPLQTTVTVTTSGEQDIDLYSKAVYAGEGYTFEFSDSGDNYIINGIATESNLIFTIENRFFEVSTCIDSLPTGFTAGVLSEDNCRILPWRFPSDPQKELLQVIFYNDELNEYASKLYGIRSGVFMPLDIYDNSNLSMTYIDTIPETDLIPTEINKFMTSPQIIYTEVGNAVVSIYTYTFDPNAMTFVKESEKITTDNPLYYGYAAHTVATDLYGYFVDKSFNIDPNMNVEPFYNNATDSDDYYFAVDDPRFSTLAELEVYIRQYFSEEIAAEMFRQAPQKYRDINGKLHTLSISIPHDTSLGNVILTDAVIEETNILYPVEQFITAGGKTALEAKSEFIIDSTTPPRWKAVRYSYPYK